jgi:hypothetical protein
MATPMQAVYINAERPSNAKASSEPKESARILETHRQKLAGELEHAKRLLDNYVPEDGEGNPYSSDTLERARIFLDIHMNWAWRRGSLAPIPKVGLGPDGSIDLYWRTPDWKLLVNIPADRCKSATFYGDDYNRQRTKGSLDPEELSIPIIAWLTT